MSAPVNSMAASCPISRAGTPSRRPTGSLGLTAGAEDYLRFVASQPCLVCGRQPSDPHHLRFAQPRALGLKVSDEFTVPLCRGHHRQLHQAGNAVAWWADLHINALEAAKGLWEESRPKTNPTAAQSPPLQASKDPPGRPHIRTRANYRTNPIDM